MTCNGMHCPAGWPGTSRWVSGRFEQQAASHGAPTHAMRSAILACRSSGPPSGSSVSRPPTTSSPLAQLIEGSAEEQALQRLGWVVTDHPTVVLTSRLADFLEGRPAEGAAKITETLKPTWEEAYHRSRPNSADPAIVRMILEGNPPRAFAAVTGEGRDDHSELIAMARGHRNEDWLGLASIWTRSAHRRRGLATAMMAALGHWAARQGARYAYLQVATVNQPGIAAYRSLGFIHHHAYRYLAPAR